jgi:uncharacterized phage infection (PIP) family protein YhgE
MVDERRRMLEQKDSEHAILQGQLEKDWTTFREELSKVANERDLLKEEFQSKEHDWSELKVQYDKKMLELGDLTLEHEKLKEDHKEVNEASANLLSTFEEIANELQKLKVNIEDEKASAECMKGTFTEWNESLLTKINGRITPLESALARKEEECGQLLKERERREVRY